MRPPFSQEQHAHSPQLRWSNEDSLLISMCQRKRSNARCWGGQGASGACACGNGDFACSRCGCGVRVCDRAFGQMPTQLSIFSLQVVRLAARNHHPKVSGEGAAPPPPGAFGRGCFVWRSLCVSDRGHTLSFTHTPLLTTPPSPPRRPPLAAANSARSTESSQF